MPSLHLDIPSIDWIAPPPRGGGRGRGKACPVRDAPAVAPKDGNARPPAPADAGDVDAWPGAPVEAMA